MRKLLFICLFIPFLNNAQESNKSEIKKEVVRILDSISLINKVKQTEKTKSDKEDWYNKVSIRGYVQVRYNGLFSSNDKVF